MKSDEYRPTPNIRYNRGLPLARMSHGLKRRYPDLQ